MESPPKRGKKKRIVKRKRKRKKKEDETDRPKKKQKTLDLSSPTKDSVSDTNEEGPKFNKKSRKRALDLKRLKRTITRQTSLVKDAPLVRTLTSDYSVLLDKESAHREMLNEIGRQADIIGKVERLFRERDLVLVSAKAGRDGLEALKESSDKIKVLVDSVATKERKFKDAVTEKLHAKSRRRVTTYDEETLTPLIKAFDGQYPPLSVTDSSLLNSYKSLTVVTERVKKKHHDIFAQKCFSKGA